MRRVFGSRLGFQLKGAGKTEVSLPSGPWMALRTRAQSSAERVMGPSLPLVQLRAMAPVRGTNPKEGRRPETPQRVEGDAMEPRVSEPMAKPTQPAETAGAEPAEEPLEPCLGFHGLRVWPPNQWSPMASAPR